MKWFSGTEALQWSGGSIGASCPQVIGKIVVRMKGLEPSLPLQELEPKSSASASFATSAATEIIAWPVPKLPGRAQI